MSWRRYGSHWDGYTREDVYEDIKFFRPDGKIEGKTRQWCRSNGFFQIEEDLWSGNWYWEYFPEEHQRYKERQQAKKRAAQMAVEITEDSLKKARRAERAELLDDMSECYGTYQYERARRRLEQMEQQERDEEREKELQKLTGLTYPPFGCDVCRKRFYREVDLDEHYQNFTGKAHNRYRRQNHLEYHYTIFYGWNQRMTYMDEKVEWLEKETGMELYDLARDQEFQGTNRLLPQDLHLLEEKPFEDVLPMRVFGFDNDLEEDLEEEHDEAIVEWVSTFIKPDKEF